MFSNYGRCRPAGSYDRFIPNRSAMEMDLAHHLIKEREEEKASFGATPPTLPRRYFENSRVMSEVLNGQDISKAKVLRFGPRKPKTRDDFHWSQFQNTSGGNQRAFRRYPKTPDHTIDVVEMRDDYYLNLLDWSEANLMAVALGGVVQVWNPATKVFSELVKLDNQDDFICSVSSGFQGRVLGVGTNTGQVQLWDVQTKQRMHTMVGHTGGVPCLSWNRNMISSGCQSGAIHLHDARQPNPVLCALKGHTQGVCSLMWSPNGHYLASGGGDSRLYFWPVASSTDRRARLATEPTGAIKALAWCPWDSNIVAWGGGHDNSLIRLCDLSSGVPTLEGHVDTLSTVSGILWSKKYRELITGHGFGRSLNQLSLWKYPYLTKVADCLGHTEHVLHMAMSPDETTIVSAGADKTLLMWNYFHEDKTKKRAKTNFFFNSVILRPGIR